MKLKPIIIGIIIFLMVVITGYFTFIHLYNKSLKWVDVKKINIKESFTVSGHVEALDKVNLRAPYSGTIKNVYFREGDNVKKDDIIAQYEKDTFNAQIQQLQTEKQKAEINYQKMLNGFRKEEILKAKNNYESNKTLLEEKKLYYQKLKKDEQRNQKLFDDKLISKKDYEDFIKNLEISQKAYEVQSSLVESAHHDYELFKNGYRKEDIAITKKELDHLNAKISELLTQYQKADIKAPFNSQIIKRFIDPNENVLSGDTLFYLVDKKQLEVIALIEEEDIANIRPNDEIKIEPDAYPQKFVLGEVTSIFNNVQEESRLLPVKIVVTKNPENLKLIPGMTVNCTFSGHQVDYLVIPKEAIQREGKKYFVETKSGKIYLEVGKSYDNMVLVKGKLTIGEKILIK